MRALGVAAFGLTPAAIGIAFYLSAGRGLSPARLLGESWPLMVLVTVLVALSMMAAWLLARLAGRGAGQERGEPAGEKRRARPR